ncbi:MAG: glycosyltransferase family 2 protein [Bacteroidales bacterium]|jgi:cellulose synthase/poly-beta-1,6-N-acetylglucosamine synthase-like glycosyltransferase|nr:glycosyltransferase family 2 protein [Bacteroidales bacterium]
MIYIVSLFFRFFKKNATYDSESIYEPEVTLFIAAYNELEFVNKKVENSFSLDYPKEKLHHIWVTDGSDDGTPQALSKFDNIRVIHNKERKGKIGALNRVIHFVKTPIVIFSDANSMINTDAVRQIVNEFRNSKVGCVAGEKRIAINNKDNAVNSGEGIYWKYESFIKKSESIINSTLGAAGELFAIRTNLYNKIEDDTILDDFIISLRIAQKGYRIKYAPNAFATEDASINIHEELKRKTRIAYGGFQTISRLPSLLNPFKNPLLTFQYISHKVFRWTLVPFSILILFFVNLFIAKNENWAGFYTILFLLQIIFYLFVLLGAIFQSKKINFKLLFAPYYLFVMNLSEIIGLFRFIRKNQSVNWERAKRK